MAPRLALALLFALAIVARTAHAANPSDRANAVFHQAQLAFERKNYAAAAAAFEEAATLAPHPAAWLNAGEAWERDGNPVRAAEDCDRALQLPNVSPQHRAEADARLSRLAPKIGTLDVRSDRTLVMKIDGSNESNVPGQRRIATGKHVLDFVDLAGKGTRTVDVEMAPGETKVIDLSEPPKATKEAPPTPPKPVVLAPRRVETAPQRGPPVASFVAWGVSVVAAGTATAFGAMTLSRQSEFQSAPSLERRDDFYTARTITNAAWAVAGVTAAAGIAFWIFAPKRATGIVVAHHIAF